MMRTIFAPGCALTIYKPHLAGRLHEFLKGQLGEIGLLDTCCRNITGFDEPTRVINTCPGCDRRYRGKGEGVATVSLWELLAERDAFPLPDYAGRRMTIIDACPTRTETRVHEAIRTLLKRMDIELVEPERTRAQGTCCGDSLWGVVPEEQVKERMVQRTSEMPVDDVVVYCVSCSKSVFIGGKRPHYMVDLLFGEETVPGTLEPADWHRELDQYIMSH